MTRTGPDAELLHWLPDRARIRVPSLRRDPEALRALAVVVADVPGLSVARVNPGTGTLLVAHGAPDPQSFTSCLSPVLDVRFEARGAAPALDLRLRTFLEDARGRVEAALGGGVNLRGLAFLLLVAVSLAQVARGRVWPPAATALWYALGVLFPGPDDAEGGSPRP